MTLADGRLKELDNPSLARNERILLRCRVASEFIHSGQYETAREALGELWQGVGVRPEVEKLKPSTAAEVLLQCGALSGWLGRAQHISGAQEKAKDLIFEALRQFQSLRQSVKVSEAQYELGMCYFRLGAYDEARVVLDKALDSLEEGETDLKAKILIRHTIVEVWTGRYHDALRILEQAGEFFEGCGDAIKGRWHGQKGLVLRRLAVAEKRADYADKAVMEFTAAIYHYEQAGHERYCANNFNNLAMLLYHMGRYAEAHENLNRAQKIFERHKDAGNIAQVSETRARVLVAEGKHTEADRILPGVIEAFEKGSDNALLADALTLQGVVRARLGAYGSSMHLLRRAITTAQESGALTNAGLAALTLIEEHGRDRLSETAVFDFYRRADKWLKDTQDSEAIARLRACARLMGRRLVGARLSDKDFSLPDAMLAYEVRFIREALEATQGSISRAAKRLGIRHQSLIHILKTRHKDLLGLRTPARTRRRTITRQHGQRGQKSGEKRSNHGTILHVEDNETVADAVRDTLEAEGWRVINCADGAEALDILKGDEPYDLLLLDYDLPHVNGVELARQVRQLSQRKGTPIIMLSASDVETEALNAGAGAFMRKPDDMGRLAEMVTCLLAK